MAVEVLGVPGEVNGYGDSMDAFRSAHETNSRILVNLILMDADKAAGIQTKRKKNDPAVAYDPNHPDNQWPVMYYHAEKGEKVFGSSLVGLRGDARRRTEADNKAALATAQKEGWRAEPYLKPQIAVLDPAVEKAAMVAKNQQLEGQLVQANDTLRKLEERLAKLEKA